MRELKEAMSIDLCSYIIFEKDNAICIWSRNLYKWDKNTYIVCGDYKESDSDVTGIKSYQKFYSYCGKEEIEKMKHILTPIHIWESYEQLHYANFDYANKKLYQNIYEFDANSAFTYGVLRLPDGFDKLKEYMSLLYNKKKNAINNIQRSKNKNLMNFLIGYFARIKEFVRVRSEIIKESNRNINSKMLEIAKNKGTVYLSNTDSIVTNDIGADIMSKYIGTDVGEFKLSKQTDKLFYKSPNAYQIGDKVVYGGVPYFAKKHTDFFNDVFARQEGSFIVPFNFSIDCSENGYKKICSVKYGEVIVTQYNLIGEKIKSFRYKIEQ